TGSDGRLAVWDPATRRPARDAVQVHRGPGWVLDVTRAGGRLVAVTGGKDGAVQVVDLEEDGEPRALVEKGGPDVVSVLLDDRGPRPVVAFCPHEWSLQIRDVETGTLI